MKGKDAYMSKIVNVFYNNYNLSKALRDKLEAELKKEKIEVSYDYNPKAAFNIVIGGDGTFINACHDSAFSEIPFIGINTGHLGFYQEIASTDLDIVINAIKNEDKQIQKIKLVECIIKTKDKEYSYYAVNEIVLKAQYAFIINFDMYVNDIFLQSFAGDGVIFSTPSGSTAYSLSAGGSILFQTLNGFQITPIAPIRSSLHRSLDKSLVVPHDTKVKIIPSREREKNKSIISVDGVLKPMKDIEEISIVLSDKSINKVVINPNWYWHNIKDKFI